MPFFSQIWKSNINPLKKTKIVTLQVRTFRLKTQKKGKKVFSSASRTGSMTVEAALVLPLFLFGAVTLLIPCSMMNRERQVQAVLERVAEDISQMAYGASIMEHGLPEGTWTAYAEVQVRRQLNLPGIRELSLSGSSLLEDGENIKLVAGYYLQYPFPIFRKEGVMKTNQSCRRAWIGKEGGKDGASGEQEADPTVYVGKDSSRYHESRTCHYLYNRWNKVSWEEVEDYRNTSGGKYYPCSRCVHGSGGWVYLMPGGSSYHNSMSCSAVTAYVRAVKKSQVEHLGACSYCSGGG